MSEEIKETTPVTTIVPEKPSTEYLVPVPPIMQEYITGPQWRGGTIEGAFQEAKDASSIPLSQLFNQEDSKCPVCKQPMPNEIGGTVPRNPEGFIVCRRCVRLKVGEQ